MAKTSTAVSVEVHFTEGFFDDDIRLLSNGSELKKLTLTTRMQTGLADITTLKLESAKEVTLKCAKRSLTATIEADATTPFVIVALRDGQFEITASKQSPGYL